MRVEAVNQQQAEDAEGQRGRSEEAERARGRTADPRGKRQQHRGLRDPADGDPQLVEAKRDGDGDETDGDRQMDGRQVVPFAPS